MTGRGFRAALATPLLLSLLACGQPSPSPSSPPSASTSTGGAIVLSERLDALASLEIGPLERGHRRGEPPPERVAIGDDWESGPAQPATGIRRWRTPSPVLADTSMWSGTRPGIRVFRDSVELEAADRVSIHEGAGRWWIDEGGGLLVSGSEGPPGPGEIEVEAAAHAYRQSRLEFIGRQPVPEDVLVEAREIGGSRQLRGLFAPAPSRATWSLDLPPDPAVLKVQPSILPPELSYLPDPDGVTFVVRVSTGFGRSTEIYRETVAPGDTGAMAAADLGPWAGQRVDLTLETLAGANDHHDHAIWLHAVVVPVEDEPRRVILLFLDTLRADRLSCYGYPRETSPALDELASRGTRFARAYAPSPWTVPSAWALFSGRRPERYTDGDTLAEQLRREGLLTVGWTANAFLGPNFGCERGFSSWQWRFKPPADHQTDLALDWLRDHPDDSAFVVVNYMDNHLPREAPDDVLTGIRATPVPYPAATAASDGGATDGGVDPARIAAEVDLYDATVRFVDQHVGRLIDGANELPGRTWIVALSDHGEELFDHGGVEHGHTLYEELVRVPLIVAGPGVEEGRVVPSMVTLQDVAPTVRGLLGLEPGAEDEAVDLGPCLGAGRECPVPESRSVSLGYTAYRGDLLGLVDPGTKYVVGHGGRQVFDLGADPRELVDRADTADLGSLQQMLEERAGRRFLPTVRVVVHHPAGGSDAPVELRLRFAASLSRVLQGPSLRGMHSIEHEGGGFAVSLDPKEDRAFVVMNHEILVLPASPLADVLASIECTVDGEAAPPIQPRLSSLDSLPRDGSAASLWEGSCGDLTLTIQAVHHPWTVGAELHGIGDSVPALDESTLEMLRAAGYIE